MRYRICRSISYRDWCRNLPKRPTPTWKSIPVAAGYRHLRRTELADVPGNGLNVASSFPTCPVKVLMSYRTIRRVRYRSYRRYIPAVWLGTYRTEHTLHSILAIRWSLYRWKCFLFCFWLRLDPVPHEHFHDHSGSCWISLWYLRA